MVLIVCEGECTEPYYLDRVRQSYELSNVRIMGRECGSNPINVANHALAVAEKHKEYDHIFCVVDRDEHPNFDAAAARVREAQNNGVPIKLIPSYPAFEIWYLYHFAYTRAPFARTGKRSPADNLLRTLRQHMPEYAKSRRDLHELLRGQFGQALVNSRRASEEAQADGEPNPSTQMHELVEFLLDLAQKNSS